MRSIKCVVIGDGAVGKTSLLISYTTNTFPQDYVPTVFDNYTTTISLRDPNAPALPPSSSSTNILNEQDSHSGPPSTHSNEHLRVFKLNLWDTAGQEEYDRLRPLSYPQTDIFLICFSVTERNSFRNVCDKWLPELKSNSNIENNPLFTKFRKLPILLIGTKADLEGTIPENDPQYISKKDIEKCVKDNGFMGYVECSAMTQIGVRDVFERAIDAVVFEPERLANKQKKSIIPDIGNNNNSNNNNNINTTTTTTAINSNDVGDSQLTSPVKTNSTNIITNSNHKQQQQQSNSTSGSSHRHRHSHNKEKLPSTNGTSNSSSKKNKNKKKDKCVIM
ncbi:similar to Saccharomyces cerevisiae YNL180C RHO5 Non-essential small GTPase of the Rho/Rac subfamily of Ras-like proteins [Maudiozyma barnettii]|uniref:Similar to Saccharomyces cerevisiae YNL180C RHO5 Non-essential small GTPase of the Rho/Rac subfamily of Ras-like proteins n=1 Tax=Maudiozyma barnettii TaxID=61262 RepID=A0A8H2VE65_9SACH|nr:Rho family GTPase RHO5 [Kazachstania barnettii]CAB4253891.1 similar to Saccharomyces cerevisiae YNL180C RHO5 Non-essential small GTPase of the Rho/Rac subfamily of Ras-like proteins [Kazachstania barnettii]CAD1781641.1 similar to Saccharomyces cerevisiae YNL180C RHO5 Non-essential small GTPase of the Rho/Rac subfamily of Ras-like proteins [Kazachstania barnettii]